MSGNFYGGQFFGGGFFGAILLDTHDGFDGNKKRHKKSIEAREELRQQIEYSIDGFPPELVEKLEQVSTPQVEDSIYVPLSKRIDFDAISEEVIGEVRKAYAEVERFEAVGKSVRAFKRKEALEEERKRKIIEQDEEAVMVYMMLMSH